ncbi:MAG: CHC2 zinc finger protein [Candidatus Nitrotoga sp. MKT]|nr:MAG: CHC2 zinc finger protein [Candidatus Nitrotoga sp. MKT]
MSSIGLRIAAGNTRKQSKFKRSNLPSPESFWAAHGITLKAKKRWVMAKCIFHDDHHASLGINTETGGFFCHACVAKGGDILSAYQLLVGCDFVTAAKALGAWEEK